jgi:hypothetical protein
VLRNLDNNETVTAAGATRFASAAETVSLWEVL